MDDQAQPSDNTIQAPQPGQPTAGPAPPAASNRGDATLAVPADAATNDQGEQVLASFGNYEILDEIARGGVGVVYKARQRGLNRIVALKILQSGMRASEEQVQRFMGEARSAAKLSHANIVPIHDFGENEGQYFFTMDYIEGESLADVIARGPVQPREALEIVKQVADALHYAHEEGVIHRDIKPGNILLDRQGRVRVTDFGLAKEISNEEMSLTMTGQIMGTPRYMSPEQAAGQTAKADARSDIFSLGVTLYEMLTGKPAFNGTSVIEMLQKVLQEEPAPPHKVNKKVHRDIETICLKAIEKVPDRRYQTALDMTQDIDRFIAGEPIEAKAVGPLGRLGRRARKHYKAILVYAIVMFLTVNGIVLALNARPSSLHLKVNTPGSRVSLDGMVVPPEEWVSGKEFKAGGHRLYVEAEPLYEPYESKFTTRPGESRSMSVTLTRRTGVVTVKTDPPDAGVTLVGENNFRATFQGPAVEQELPTGEYALLVHKENYLAKSAEFNVTSRRTNQYDFALLSITMWTAATSGNILSVPVVDDFNGDHAPDVVAGDDDGHVYCFSGRSGIPIWVFAAQDAVQAPLSTADLNKDGNPDLVAGSTDGRLYALNGKDGQPLWLFFTKGGIHGPALLRDVTGDGVPDAFVGSDDGALYGVDGINGKLLWKFSTRGTINSCVSWLPPGAGSAEVAILVGSSDRNLYCLNAKTGATLWTVDVGEPLYFPPRIEDLDQNGHWYALLPTPRSPGDARTLTSVSLRDHKRVATRDDFPVWFDLDGDGKKEKLVATADGTTCMSSASPLGGSRAGRDAEGEGAAKAGAAKAASGEGNVAPPTATSPSPQPAPSRGEGVAAAGPGEQENLGVLWQSPYVAVAIHFAEVTGDGVVDMIFNNGPDQLICISGKDGQPVGRVTLDANVGRGYSLDDVDRDGVPDLVLGAGRRLYCCSWIGGRQRWLAHAGAYYDTPFSLADGKVFTKTSGGQLACYQPDVPQPIWQVTTSEQPAPHSALAAGGGFVADTDARTRRLAVFQAADGQLVWSATLPGLTNAPIGSPTIVNHTVVVGDGETGLYCFGLADGKPRWQQALPKVTGQATSDGDRLWIADGNNTLHCLTLADGKSRWNYPVSDPFPGPPAVVDIDGDRVADAVALCDNGFIYALNGKTGKVLWELQFTGQRSRTRLRIALADVDRDGFPEGVICSLAGNIVCLDLKQGKPRWIFSLHERVMGPPTIADMNGDQVPDVLIGTMDRRLHCVSGTGKEELWSYEVGAQIRYSAPLVIPATTPGAAPLVMVGTGPPDNGLYCLSGASPKPGHGAWTGPWKQLMESNRK